MEFDANGAGPQTVPNSINADYAVSEGDGHIFVRLNVLFDMGRYEYYYGDTANDWEYELRK